MPDVTPEEAQRDLERLAAEADGILEGVLVEAADRAAGAVAAVWPVQTGRSAAGWAGEGPAVVNPVDYTSTVRGGIADDLVEAALDAEEPEIRDTLDRRLRAAGGWEHG